MKILYITMVKPDRSSGVFKKIISQIHAFEKENCQCTLLILAESKAMIFTDYPDSSWIDINKNNNFISELIRTTDVGYVRFELLRHVLFRWAVENLKKHKKRIVLEIPTFPPYQESIARAKGKLAERNYVGALKTFIGAGIVWHDCERLAHLADIVCVVGSDKKFRNSKTIRIENGIDLASNPFVEHTERKRDYINIIAVSNFAIWNGYDRAIKGLAEYIKRSKKPSQNFRLTLVGDKKKAGDLIVLSQKYGLKECVLFTGSLSGEDLDEAYAEADIALGALGNHRRKVFANSSLKAKEYAARGMLMVLSDAEGIEEEIKEKCLIVHSDETPLDYSEIAKWYLSKRNIAVERKFIHDFSAEHYSWNVQIKKILSVIKAVE